MNRKNAAKIFAVFLAAFSMTACGMHYEPAPDSQDCCGGPASSVRPIIPPATTLDYFDTQSLLVHARAFAAASHYDSTMRLLNRAAELDSHSISVFRSRGIAYLEARKFDSAEVDMTRASALGAPDSGMLYFYGELYWKTNRYQRAIEAFDRALKFSPGNACVLNSMGITYKLMGEYDSAIVCYDKAIAREPKVDFFYKNRAWVHGKMGHPDQATDDILAARNLERTSKSYRPLLERGLINY